MPLARLTPTPSFQDRPAFPRPAGGDALAATSPARALQDRLEASAGMSLAERADRWSPRSSLALILSASLGLWAAILVMAGHTLHAIA